MMVHLVPLDTPALTMRNYYLVLLMAASAAIIDVALTHSNEIERTLLDAPSSFAS